MEPVCGVCKKLDKEVLKNFQREQDCLDEFLLEVKKDISEDLYVGDLLGVKNFKYHKLRESLNGQLEGNEWNYFDVKNFKGCKEPGLFTVSSSKFNSMYQKLNEDEKQLKT